MRITWRFRLFLLTISYHNFYGRFFESLGQCQPSSQPASNEFSELTSQPTTLAPPQSSGSPSVSLHLCSLGRVVPKGRREVSLGRVP